MLSIRYPSVMHTVKELPIGLWPITIKADSVPKLIVKTSKEAILTAKVRQGFLIYLIPYELENFKSLGFLASFFDDPRHPYTTGGGLIKELSGRELSKLFLSPKVDVHFFDEVGREMLSYRATFKTDKSHRDALRSAVFPSAVNLNQAQILHSLTEWFKLSGPMDDQRAINVSFDEPLMPEDIIYFDMRPENHRYHGSPGFSSFTLEREVPGLPQELEIISLLERTFSSDCIYLAPKRTYDKEEMVDILVVTEKSVLLIQAKDNQNLESTVNQTIERKKSAAAKALKSGVAQVKGAISYLRRSTPFVVIINDEEIEVDVEGKAVYGLVVVKELFDDSYDSYTPQMIELYKKTQVPCIPLSYGELHNYTRFIQGDDEFFKAFMKVFEHGVDTGAFLRLRVHPKGTVI